MSTESKPMKEPELLRVKSRLSSIIQRMDTVTGEIRSRLQQIYLYELPKKCESEQPKCNPNCLVDDINQLINDLTEKCSRLDEIEKHLQQII